MITSVLIINFTKEIKTTTLTIIKGDNSGKNTVWVIEIQKKMKVHTTLGDNRQTSITVQVIH